jgi:hypothetical protein
MSKTTAKKTTTRTRRNHPDAELLDMIKRLDVLWRESKKLDVSPRSPTFEDCMIRQTEVCHEACDLERQIAATRSTRSAASTRSARRSSRPISARVI